MIKRPIKINNPLTVIAIFSMLTETSAAVSLPYIDSENQHIYVWFLIIFPSVLITFFFLTLNFNSKTLYTPREHTKESHRADRCAEVCLHNTDQAPAQQQAPHRERSSLLLSKADNKPGAFHPQRFTFLPQGHRDYDPGSSPEAVSTKTSLVSSADHHLLLEGTVFSHLHVIDMSHSALQLSPKHTLTDILNTYKKRTRTHSTHIQKNDMLLLLTTPQSEPQLHLQKRSLMGFKTPSAFADSTIITYNIETRQLNILCPA